jgi:Peptidase C13 family
MGAMRSGALFGLCAVAVATCMLAGQAVAGARAEPRGVRWQAVLAAGDDAEPVFDDATQALAKRLLEAGVPATDIHRLSASPTQLRDGAQAATIPLLLRRIAGLRPRPGERCLVFLTSHGEEGAGLWLARSDAALRPDQLARALSQGCAGVPTVVIVSACYSGGFVRGAMARSNRVIFTAARANRPSFGCAVGRRYSFFDACLIAAVPRFSTWRGVFGGTKDCVGRMEKRLDARPSDPQAYFGSKVAALAVGF